MMGAEDGYCVVLVLTAKPLDSRAQIVLASAQEDSTVQMVQRLRLLTPVLRVRLVNRRV